jgi:hypothetical protein
MGEWSARPRDLYLTAHNTNKRQDGFEPTIPAGERPQTHALDRVATGTVIIYSLYTIWFIFILIPCILFNV